MLFLQVLFKIQMEQSIAAHEYEPKYWKIWISNPKLNIIDIPKILIWTLLFKGLTPTSKSELTQDLPRIRFLNTAIDHSGY